MTLGGMHVLVPPSTWFQLICKPDPVLSLTVNLRMVNLLACDATMIPSFPLWLEMSIQTGGRCTVLTLTM